MIAPLVATAGLLLFGVVLSSPVVAQDPAPDEKKSAIPECKEMKKTASGLEYGVLRKGRDEAGPKPDDLFVAHYTGWLTDGTEFDGSRKKGVPLTMACSQVIKGWTEGLLLMTPGAHYKFVIPSSLGYGEQGGGPIPPNSTLIFEVELLDIKRMPELPPALESKPIVTASGVSFQVLQPGEGETCGERDGLAFRYSIWKPAGELLDCSERQNDHRIAGTMDLLPFPWLKDLATHFKKGMKIRATVPQEQFPNAGADTVWTLELTGIGKVPEFRNVDPTKTVTTDSGLVYEVLEMGTGKSPKATDTVVCNYAGWLTDGTPFDSSFARATVFVTPLNRVIKGWTEGMQLMKAGSKFLFSIPSDLAYGPRGSGKIPANATLVFLVELIEVKDPVAPQGQAR